MTPARFTILARGVWTPGHVVTTRVPSTRPIIDEVERAIETAWHAAAKPGVQLFDGPMCRLESFDASPGELKLTIAPTSYKPFVGTNLSNPRLADTYGPAVLANPLGASVALTTSDGYLLLGRRGDRVAYYPNRVHPFAGALEPAEADDVFAIVHRELGEELNLPPSDVRDARCLGLARNNEIRQTEIIFAAETRLSLADLERQLDPDEHDAIWPVATNPAALDAAAADPLLTPIATATITMWRVASGLVDQ